MIPILVEPFRNLLKRGKYIGNFFVKSEFQTSDQPELFNAHAHDAKHVLSFATLTKYQDPSDPSRSLIISPVPQPVSSTT